MKIAPRNEELVAPLILISYVVNRSLMCAHSRFG